MAAHAKPPGAPAPPPPPPPLSIVEATKGFMRRMFPLFLTVNLLVGVYRVVMAPDPASPADKSLPEPVAAPPAKVFPSIPDDKQRRVYRWMLEEKRKVKPRDAAERRKLDDEKALLKEIIRAESLPRI